MQRISEPQLVLPSLYAISKADRSLSTTEIIEYIEGLLQPLGEDSEKSLSRTFESKFRQKVRNLVSHKKLLKLGLVSQDMEYITPDGEATWQITDAGQEFVNQYNYLIESIVEQKLDYYQAIDVLAQIPKFGKSSSTRAYSKPIYLLEDSFRDADVDESTLITEGTQRIVKSRIRERSRKLRQYAIEHYQDNGRILCAACGFDFAAVYGEHGAGFIEIHHTKPIFSYDEEDSQKTVKAALKNLVPLCSNCHRMIHRKRERMLTVDELREIINAAKS